MSIQVQGIAKSFSQGQRHLQILNDLNFKIADGELVAILGQSGSGKSTLLSLISGLEKPDAGRIEIANQDVTGLSENDWSKFRSKNLGIVFQQYHLIPHLTAFENVLLPMQIAGFETSEAEQRATELLTEVGLADRLNHLPSQLSGGESQRVAIARALSTKPKLILADEPSGNLDVKTGDMVMDFLFTAIRKYKTSTLLVTHNLELAKKCDRILQLANGQAQEVK